MCECKLILKVNSDHIIEFDTIEYNGSALIKNTSILKWAFKEIEICENNREYIIRFIK